MAKPSNLTMQKTGKVFLPKSLPMRSYQAENSSMVKTSSIESMGVSRRMGGRKLLFCSEECAENHARKGK